MADLIARSGNARDILQNLPRPATIRMKVVSIGDEGVGKSCVIKRYCEERFISKYISTIGIDYGVKRVQLSNQLIGGGAGGSSSDGPATTEVRVNFWDLAGGAEYAEIRNEFFKDAQAAVLVFDVTSAASFARLEQWLREAYACGMPKDAVVAVCANKVDLPKRAVTEAEGRRWATAKGFAYWETSAQSAQNVGRMFQQLFEGTLAMKKL